MKKEEKIEEEITKEVKKEAQTPTPPIKMRQIIIETDGNNIKIVKSEVAGRIELIAILEIIIIQLKQLVK